MLHCLKLASLLPQENINAAAKDWGLQCLRYEISKLNFSNLVSFFMIVVHTLNWPFSLSSGDISPPGGIRAAMEMQAEAERKKRAQILDSEGAKMNQINRAQGYTLLRLNDHVANEVFFCTALNYNGSTVLPFLYVELTVRNAQKKNNDVRHCLYWSKKRALPGLYQAIYYDGPGSFSFQIRLNRFPLLIVN